MIYVLIPHYHNDPDYFIESLNRQKGKFIVLRRDRKNDGIYWTRAMNDFRDEIKNYRFQNSDCICILNNDLVLADDLFEKGRKVKRGKVLIPKTLEKTEVKEWGIEIDWSKKSFKYGDRIDCFAPRGIFMNILDFIDSGGFSPLLPHYLADYEFSIRMIRKGLKPVRIDTWVEHFDHERETRAFSWISEFNPFFWTVFLFKACWNRYLPINLVKAWIHPLIK